MMGRFQKAGISAYRTPICAWLSTLLFNISMVWIVVRKYEFSICTSLKIVRILELQINKYIGLRLLRHWGKPAFFLGPNANNMYHG
jgi:hypothetical protein